MNQIGMERLSLIVYCPVCHMRKCVESFFDPFTSTLATSCKECRSQRANSKA